MMVIGRYGFTYAQNVQLTWFCFAQLKNAMVCTMSALVSWRASMPSVKFVNSPM